MLNYFISIFKNNRLIRGSIIFFIGTLVVNFGNYIYHLFMARFLGVVVYGELQSILSLFAILGIPLSAISVVVVKYAANFTGENRPDKIFTLFKFFTSKMLMLGLGILAIVLIVSPYLTRFLQLSSVWPVIISTGGVVVGFLLIPARAILQGTQRFKSLSFNLSVEMVTKIIVAVGLVMLGWRLNGAVLGGVVAGIIAYVFSFWSIKFILKQKSDSGGIEVKNIAQYSLPVFFSLLFLTLFYTADIILVKHFMPPELAGQYGGLSILGRAIFFSTAPMVAVMFSLSSEALVQSQANSRKVVRQALQLVSLAAGAALAVYFIFPELVIKILLGRDFLVIAPYLGWFSIAMVFYSLVNLLAHYFLSIHRTAFVYFLALGILAQMVLISIFHGSLGQIIWIMDGVMGLVLMFLLIYYIVVEKLANYSQQKN